MYFTDHQQSNGCSFYSSFWITTFGTVSVQWLMLNLNIGLLNTSFRGCVHACHGSS